MPRTRNAEYTGLAASEVKPRRELPVLKRGKTVGAVSVAVSILNYLADASQPVGVTRIAQDLGLSSSTTFNTLRTLVAHDYLALDETRKTYRLSVGLLRIARAAAFTTDEFEVLRSDIEAIANEHRVSIAVWKPVRANRKVLIHSFRPSTAAIQIQMALGSRLPLLVGSSGRLFAAFGSLDEAEIREQFKDIRWQSEISIDAFRAQVADVAKQGYAVDHGDFVAGTVMISVPIFDKDGKIAMSMSAMMFLQQYSEDLLEPLVSGLKKVAENLSQLMGR